MTKEAWESLQSLVGSWESADSGIPGTGKGQRTYDLVLGGKFLRARNRVVWEPTEQNPKGEVHEDWGFYSYDRGSNEVVLRQFHAEGFVNQYVLERFDPKDGTFVFVTKAIENIPSGWRARETVRLNDRDAFEENFDLAEPGKGFEPYTHTRFRRTP